MGKCRCNSRETKEQENLREKQLDKCFEHSNCASAKDCTGTVVTAPLNEDMLDNYQEKYHFRPNAIENSEDEKME